MNGYYRDPEVVFLAKGSTAGGRAAVASAGYFIAPHCDPDCCAAFGGVAAADIGPFVSAGAARKWSQTYLAELK